jgi:hypothetical protein
MDLEISRRDLTVCAGGLQFVAGWLIWIDGAVAGNHFSGWREPPWYFYLPGFISTFVLLMYVRASLPFATTTHDTTLNAQH